jgi:hypothetical protein
MAEPSSGGEAMIEVKAHYDGKVIVLDEPVKLPKGRKLLVQIVVVNAIKKPASKTARKPSGKRTKKRISVFDWLAENAVADDDLPPDLGHQHDHYLYGTPKKPAVQP